MNHLALTITTTAVFCLTGCGTTMENDGTEVVRHERIDSVELVRSGELRFTLDEETCPDFLATYYDSRNGFFYFHNIINGYIERFHTDSTVKSPVRIKAPFRPWSMNVVSQDSIYLLNVLETMSIRLIDGQGVKKASYSVDDDATIATGGQGQPYVTPYGLVYSCNTLKEDFCLAIVDTESGETTDKLLPFPEMYRNFYGSLLMMTPYTAYNSRQGTVVIGFPADNNIHVIDLATRKITVHYARSKYAKEKLKPLRKGHGGLTVSNEEEIEYFREITSYGNMLYDPWNNVYYRIVEKSTPMPGVNLSNRAKKLAVMILDSSFRTIGESDIPDDASASFRYCLFVSPDGLNIQMLTGEDELAIATYSLKAKK